jgi:hypothetical protein
MKNTKLMLSYVLAAVMALNVYASAGPLQQFQAAQIYLQKARMTAAVQAKNENLKKAKEQLMLANYDRGGYRAAALSLTMQAIAKVGEFKLDRANQLIDIAIVKIKHAIQTLNQETAARKKGASVKK